MTTVIGIIILIAILLFVFWPAFRDFVTNTAADLLDIIAEFARLYSIAAVCVLGVISILVLTGFFIPSAIYKGIAFGLSALLVYAIWLPAGIILRIFRVNKDTFPQGIKALASWLCFIGFLGVLYPDTTSSFKFILIAALVAGIFSGMTMKINTLDKIVFPVVVILLIITGIKYIFPETFRSNTEWLSAIGGAENTAADRGRDRIKAYSVATYVRLKRDTKVAYVDRIGKEDELILADTAVDLKKDSLFLMVNHKDKVLEYQGQGFVKICLRKPNGSFINGKTVWIEVDLIEVGSRATMDPSLGSSYSESSGFQTESCTLHPGETWFPDHTFQTGEKISYTIEGSPVNIQRNGTKVLLEPGTYGGNMPSAGVPVFMGTSGLSKVSVSYGS